MRVDIAAVGVSNLRDFWGGRVVFGRIWVRMLMLLLAAGAMPAVGQTGAPPRIVAVGDLHGDFAAWRDIARGAGLIDTRGNWAGGATVLVQAGDVADRGPDSLKIIQDLMRLQREAQAAGGRVVMLVGNHEAMNMTGDLRYVSAGEYAAFADSKSVRRRSQVFEANQKAIEAFYRNAQPGITAEAIKQAWIATMPLGKVEHQAAWDARGPIGKWMVSNPAVLLLGGTLFVHAGLSAVYAGQPIAAINKSVAAALAARDTAETSIINDPGGPLWYRGLARTENEPAVADDAHQALPAQTGAPVRNAMAMLSVGEELDTVLGTTGARRMIIAHTPNLSGILIQHDGRLVRIDTGISAAYGGRVSYLEIVGDTLTPHYLARTVAAAAK